MSPFQVIVLATPVFFLLIGIEYLLSRRATARVPAAKAFKLNDLINSISLGIISQLGSVLSKLLNIGIYTAVFGAVALFPDVAFWSTWYGVVLALIFYDFCYYWLHRAGHVVNVFWAAHVVHHQSQHYNLSTALRQTSSGPFLGWIFYLPMALAGVPPVIFGIVALIDLLYQFWVHTEQVGKLGWFDRVFCSPSNHRVHHAVNDPYIDRNYGGIFVIWDRMFGSFQEELDAEPCVYGTRGQLDSWDPVWANLQVYAAMAKDSWRTRHWGDKLRIWLKPPGWQPADLTRDYPKPAFTLASVTEYNPPLSSTKLAFAALQFIAALGAVTVFLWNADPMPWGEAAIWVTGISACMWAIGLFMQGRLSALEVLILETAVVATLSANGMLGWFMLWKPLPMTLAMLFIALRAGKNFGKLDALLMAAAFFSLGGDVFLMIPGDYFIPGLASFLVAHVFYIALFKQGHSWFPSKGALAAVLGFGAVMYAILWGSLGDPILKGAVAAYVTVISLMTAQAIGRAKVNGDAASRWVAFGGCIFMVSDSLIAINKFLTPVPLSALWILLTYYAAQMLIVHFSRTLPPRSAA